MRNANSKGFTAVELLVTLFVAAAFLIASYQLFSVVIRDGAATRAEAAAASVAYEYLREYENIATNPCLPETPLVNQPLTVDGLVDVTVSVTISCPSATAAVRLSKVAVAVNYNNPTQTVTYATFTNGAGTLSTNTNGLVGWWRLNNNTLDSVGVANGSAVSMSYTTSQNGSANNAASLNGTSGHVTIPNAQTLNVGGTMTVTAWIYPTTLSSRHPVFSTRVNNAANAFQLEVGVGSGGTNRLAASGTGVWVHESTNNVITLNAWNHVAYSRPSNASIGSLYVNGIAVGTSNSNAFSYANNADPKTIGRGSNGSTDIYFGGRIDDVRLYNRSLSATEINTIYSGDSF